jgi:hypothetical protein
MMQEVPTHVAPQDLCVCVCVCVFRPDHLMQEVPLHVEAQVVCVCVEVVGGCMCVCFVCIAFVC